jgi:3-carboxymuconate cyclase
MSSWSVKFVVGANPELGGNKLRLMALTDNNRIIQLDSSNELVMPSSFAYDKERNILYVTDELNWKNGKIGVFSILENKLQLLQAIQTKGSNPCHVVVDEKRKLLFVSHYSGGGIVCYRLQKNGLIDKIPLFIMDKYRSFHCVLPLKDGFIALNSINDEMIHFCYSSEQLEFDSLTVKIPSPRQVKHCDSNRVLIVSEIESMIYIYDIEEKAIIQKTYSCAGKISTNKAASIWVSMNKETMMISNRGEDSLVAFDIEKNNNNILKNPRALFIGGNKCPRDFDVSYDEEYAVVGFTESNCVTVYKINKRMNRAVCVASKKVIAPLGMQILQGESK